MKKALVLLVLACVMETVTAVSVTLLPWNEQCGNNNGRIEASASGGQFPYTYLWSTGATTAVVTGLDAGTYSVTVMDNLGAQANAQITLLDVPEIQVPDMFWTGASMGVGEVLISSAGLHACPGLCDAGFAWNELGCTPNVVSPVTYFPAPDPNFSSGLNPAFTYFCANDVPVLQITDATGCTGSFPVTGLYEELAGPMSLMSVEPACGPTGSITMNAGSGTFFGELQLLDASFNFVGNTVPVDAALPQQIFQGLIPGTYHISRILLGTTELCITYLMNINVPSAGNPCGTVSGDVFLDHDQDCVQDALDELIPYRVLAVLPGPQYTISDADGHYDLGLSYGNFTINHQDDAGFYQVCPPAQQQPFAINGVTSDVVVDFADSSLTQLDVLTSLYSTAIRPGFQAGYSCYVTNSSGQLSGLVDVTFTIPAPLTYVSATPVPASVVGNVLTWTGLPALGAYDQQYLHITVQVPPDPLLIGTFVTATLSATQSIAESDLVNNSVVLTREITGSYDPNDKRARTSSGLSDALYYIGTDEWVEYVIRFQNTGNDTAFTVVVTDTLSEELDMATFQQGVSSHAFSVSLKPDRVIEWRFEGIDLPDSTTNWLASNGFVAFRFRPQLPISPGNQIENIANIYFDFNEPVITEPSVLVAELSTGVGSARIEPMFLRPNPATDRVYVSEPSFATRVRSWEVLTSTGGIVLQGNGPIPATGIGIGHMENGAYLLRISTLNEINNLRFIKIGP
ncbi:MAG: hypothetical protein WAS33_14335 [Candidatus Promineifilaceae bacterium]